jgi:2-haloacid dehalogenase
MEGAGVANRPQVVAFDIIGTTFSLETLRSRLVEAGLSPDMLELWFAQSLRDAFALAATDSFHPFRDVLAANLVALLRKQRIKPANGTMSEFVETVLADFGDLSPHSGAGDAVERLKSADTRIVALTNGARAVTEKLLEKAGLRQQFDAIVSVEDISTFKPRREVYHHAASFLGVEPSQFALIASHPWDIHGAASAGLTTGFVRRGNVFPPIMRLPTVQGEGLADVARQLMELPIFS